MCCCDQCYNKRPRGHQAVGEGGAKPHVPVCNCACVLWNILFYLFMVCAGVGIPLWISGVIGYDFLDYASENFTRGDCMMVRYEVVIETGNKGQKNEKHYYWMSIPSANTPVDPATVASDRVYKVEVNGFSVLESMRNIREKEWQDNNGANYIGTMVDQDGKTIETDDMFTLETCYWSEPVDNDTNFTWDVELGLESNLFQGCKTAGMILTFVGLLCGLPLLCLSDKGCPMCVGYAMMTQVAIAFCIVGGGLLAAGIIGIVVDDFVKHSDSSAMGIGVATLVIGILMLIAVIPMFAMVCMGVKKAREVNCSNQGAVSAPASQTTGGAPPAYTEGV